jgi:lipopolysaccharide export system protein LptA
VIQKGKGDFHGEHMVYNTKTGEMESGDNSPTSRVSMQFLPKSAEPAKTSDNNCGYPAGTAPAKKASKTEGKQ